MGATLAEVRRRKEAPGDHERIDSRPDGRSNGAGGEVARGLGAQKEAGFRADHSRRHGRGHPGTDLAARPEDPARGRAGQSRPALETQGGTQDPRDAGQGYPGWPASPNRYSERNYSWTRNTD